MNTKTRRVLRGFLGLDAAERTELVAEMNRYLQGNADLRESISKGVRTNDSVNFGPAPGPCPCCNR